MDWGWIYGTLIRNAGWTFQQCGEQCAAACFEFFEHLAEFPPDYVILAGYYGAPRSRRAKTRTAPDNAALSKMAEVFGPAQSLPEDIRKRIDWAESFGKKQPN